MFNCYVVNQGSNKTDFDIFNLTCNSIKTETVSTKFNSRQQKTLTFS